MHSPFFNKLLLILTVGFLLLFLFFKWTGATAFDAPDAEKNFALRFLKDIRLYPVETLFLDAVAGPRQKICQYKSLLIIFTTNFIGMTFSRGWHQQFYSWYSYSFPFLVDAALGPGKEIDPNHGCKHHDWPLTKFALIISLEMAWSCPKPRTPYQSYVVCVVHAFILFGLIFLQGKLPTYQRK